MPSKKGVGNIGKGVPARAKAASRKKVDMPTKPMDSAKARAHVKAYEKSRRESEYRAGGGNKAGGKPTKSKRKK